MDALLIGMDELDSSLLKLIDENAGNVAARAATASQVSRQTTAARLRRLTDIGMVEATGVGRGRQYALRDLRSEMREFPLKGLREDIVWRGFASLVSDFPENVQTLWHYGMTEMINNAIDHSGGQTLRVGLKFNAVRGYGFIQDDGEGIFNRLQRLLNLFDPAEAILELSKGKLTTDPARHTGEGIFFTSRAFDRFTMLSRALQFSHDVGRDDWLIEKHDDQVGTVVLLELANQSARVLRDVFGRFAQPDEFVFANTVVPVRLAQQDGERLVSRSQAKRLVVRFERFKTVVLDFNGVDEIGQAFADELFRVFRAAHPEVILTTVNTASEVARMIRRATAAAA